MHPYNHKLNQKIQTDVKNVSLDRVFLARFQIPAAAAVATSNTDVHAAVGLTASAQAVTTNITNPAVPRNIIVKGNAAGIAGNVTITGTNYAGETIAETIALDAANAVEGVKAFKTVTKIDLPAKTNASGDNVSVGWGDKLGLPYKLALNTIDAAYLDGTKEATAPTVTISATNIENNTIDLNSALNGKNVDVIMKV